MIVTDEMKKAFQDRGFVVLRQFFDSETTRRVLDWAKALESAEPGAGEEAKYYEASLSGDEGLLVRAENIMIEKNAAIRDLVLCPRTREALEALMGDEPVLFKDKVNYKLPGCRADKLHQDQAAGWGTYADFFATMFVALDPNTLDNAPLSIMNSGNYQRGLMTEEWKPLSDDDPPFEPQDEYLVFEGEPGDVIVFDCYVPHGSPPNTSDQPRRNLYLTFNRASDGDHRKQYYADKWKSYAPNTPEEARANSSFRV
jgi:ectoine hydroxylase-related dioxygenase (phytanoyl-CoA dioxygenase family)